MSEIFIGNKPVMTYVLVALTSKDSEITLLARGKNISKAVDTLEILKRKFMKDPKITIETSTVQLDKNVSEIKIVIEK